MAVSTQKPKQGSLGCGVLMWMGIMAFTVFTVVATFPGLTRSLALLVHCPAAVETIEDTISSGSVRRQGGGGSIATTTTKVTCRFADGTEKLVENDPLVVMGFGVALAGGAVLGLVLWLVTRIMGAMNRKPTPSPAA
jgi:hypothetical protein